VVYSSFLTQGLVDKGYFIVSPTFLSQKKSIPLFSKEIDINFTNFKKLDLGENMLFEGYFR